MRWWAAALLALAGCHATEPDLKPKYQAEEYVVPPADDPRYAHMNYPKEVLFDDVVKKGSADQPKDFMQNPKNFGAGAGMPGRPGM
jgi:hypothetical protein